MPQHSKGSWDAFLTKQKSEVEGIRKKAMIAYRRQQSAAPAGTGSQADEKSASNTEPPSSPESPPPPEVQGEGLSNEITLEELKSSREFRAITEFLGSGGADGRTDDEVWPILSDLVSRVFQCSTSLLMLSTAAPLLFCARMDQLLGDLRGAY